MIGKLKDLFRTQTGEWVVSFTTLADPRPLFDEFTGKDVSVEIKKASRRRSKTANDFMWAMCSDIGNAMRPPLSKEDVYRNIIKDYGRFSTLHIRSEAVESFRSIWATHGIGWFTEVLDYSPFPGATTVFAYYGTSTYTVEEMSRVLDALKREMDDLGLMIPVSREEEERMLSQWGRALCRRTGSATSADEHSA